MIEAATLDMLPSYFKRYYKLNSDNSGFYMDGKNSGSASLGLPSENVFYHTELDDISEFMEDHVANEYLHTVKRALIAQAFSIIVAVLLPFGPLLSALSYFALLAISTFFLQVIASIYAFVMRANVFNDDLTVLPVEQGLANLTNIADSVEAVEYGDFFQLGREKTIRRIQANSDRVKIRQMSL